MCDLPCFRFITSLHWHQVIETSVAKHTIIWEGNSKNCFLCVVCSFEGFEDEIITHAYLSLCTRVLSGVLYVVFFPCCDVGVTVHSGETVERKTV